MRASDSQGADSGEVEVEQPISAPDEPLDEAATADDRNTTSPRRGMFSRAANTMLSLRSRNKSSGDVRQERPSAASIFGTGNRSPRMSDLSPREDAPDAPLPPLPRESASSTDNPGVAPGMPYGLPPEWGPAEISGPRLVADSSAKEERLTVSIMSSKKVYKQQYFTIGIIKPSQKEWVITPRRLSDFRELHAALVKQYGEQAVPPLPGKKTSDKEMSAALQDMLQALVGAEPFASSRSVASFLDPLYQPSAYCATQVLVAAKKGVMMVMLSRVWRSMLCVLCNSLYVYRSEEDTLPADIISLEYATIEIVREHQPGWPQHVFKVHDLQKGSETLFGLETTKEVGEWILALREAKVNKMGLGYWVKAPGEDDAPLPEPLVRRKQELDAGNEIFRQWLLDGGCTAPKPERRPTAVSSGRLLGAKAIPLDAHGATESELWFKARDDGSLQLMGGTRERMLELLLDPMYDFEWIRVFLTTYRLLLTSSELFLTLVSRYTKATSAEARARVGTVLSQWVSIHYFDFARDQLLARSLLDFISAYMDPGSDEVQSVMAVLAAMTQEDVRNDKQWLRSAPKPILPDIYHR